ncbi:multidrug effflux MFS transporter [Verrucomicrobiales bacterium BCK34]|nr:multidrug effflux MFS transporter [Verrucomicrobiales bacterium BCK34]
MKVDQPILGKSGTLLLLTILGAFPPLTIDLYLPALPQMAETFATSHTMVNLTLGAFMVAFAIGMLFWGPLSERTGRKPILLTALAFYITSSLLCAIASSVDALIVFRILQGLAGGGVTVIGTSIVKDLFDGRERERAMALIMSLVTIAPMIAPVLGAFLLKIASWRMMFVVLAIFGAGATLLVACYRETLTEKTTGPLTKTWGRLGIVMKNPRFAFLLAIFALVPMALMAFLGISSYVYIDRFGLSEQAFSFIFAINAGAAALGPVLYLKLSRFISVRTLILGCFVTLSLAGIAMLSVGSFSPLLFAALAAVSTLAVITVRVPGANLLLEQQSKDTGSAAALIQFSGMMMGAASIQIVSTLSPDLIQNYGVLLIVVGATCAALWTAVQHRPFVVEKLFQPS